MSPRLPRTLSFALAGLLVAGMASAGEIVQLAELIVGKESPASAAPAKSPARVQRERAKAEQKETPYPIVIEPQDEAGVLSPRGGAPADARAFEQRARARSMLQGNEAGVGAYPNVIPGQGDATTGATTNLRNRARAYTGTGNFRDLDLSQLDKDGVPLVACRDTDNVSGRIGDDTLSGSLVILVHNGQQIKVRCR